MVSGLKSVIPSFKPSRYTSHSSLSSEPSCLHQSPSLQKLQQRPRGRIFPTFDKTSVRHGHQHPSYATPNPCVPNHRTTWIVKLVLVCCQLVISVISLTLFIAFYEDDPVDLALKWNAGEKKAIAPVIMPANDKRPGGDWEAGKLLLKF